MKLCAIDLFAGCGGISEGLRQAGFEILAGADNNEKYAITYKQNFPLSKFVSDSISEVSPLEFCERIGIKNGDIDLLAGGPPCQGFSKNVPRSQRETASKNNQLVNTFLDYCEAIQPRAILMENVAEMRNGFGEVYTDSIFDRLSKAGYTVSESVINSADYGVPQRRRRAFFIALRGDVQPFEFPRPCFSRDSDMFSGQHRNVSDAISDLPQLKNGEGAEEMQYTRVVKSAYQREMRNGAKTLWNHQTKKLSEIQFRRLSTLKPGEGIKQLPDDLRPKGGYSGAYGRLTWEMVAPTITRWVFHAGSGRWGHPEDIRILTTRETARIQSFPDTYKFFGSFNDMAGQLGNAVPPKVAKILGEAIRDRLSSRDKKPDQIIKT